MTSEPSDIDWFILINKTTTTLVKQIEIMNKESYIGLMILYVFVFYLP